MSAIFSRRTLAASVVCTFAAIALRAQTAPSTPAPRTITTPATLEAFESADLYAKETGYLVEELQADIGAHVKKGDVLAVIDNPELKRQIDSAEALVAARQEMAKAAGATVRQSQRMVEVFRSQVASDQADLALADASLKRQEAVSNAITVQELDEVRAKAKVAAARVEATQARMAAAEADTAVAQANVGVAQSQVAVAAAEVQRLQTLLQYTKVTAPFDGVITRRLVSRGDLVQSGAANRATPLFTCQRIDVIRVFGDIPESSAAFITADTPGGKGTPVSIKIIGLDNQVITSTVTRIAFSLNPGTRTMRAEIDLPNSEEKLRPGMYAQITLTLPPAAPPQK